MNYTEAKHRIIRKLPDDFLEDDGNRDALNIMEDLFDLFERDEARPSEHVACACNDMAICILEFIKRGYAKTYQDAGVKKYIEALERGINALERLPGLEEKAWMYDELNK